jgi:hypothetical protein
MNDPANHVTYPLSSTVPADGTAAYKSLNAMPGKALGLIVGRFTASVPTLVSMRCESPVGRIWRDFES